MLIVASSREDRRILFDTLETQGHGTVFSARDVDHARIMLEQRPGLGLIIMELRGDAHDVVTFCAQLHGLPEYA